MMPLPRTQCARPGKLRLLLTLLFLSSLLLPSLAAAQGAGDTPARPSPLEPLRFEYIGPGNAGRISAAAGIPGDTLTYYLGAASGGIWKTVDGGRMFAPVFDGQGAQAIGALAVAPSDPNIVWAGTGEAWAIRDADVMGDGIYRSTDAGRTWQHMGLRESGRIGRILIHPSNPDIVLACVLGRATGPQPERGVYRTTDGGQTWKRTLFVNPNTGCSGISMDATDPDVVYAATWEVVMHTWAMFSGGPGSGVYKSTDGGISWKRLRHQGLPRSPVGKIDVAVAPSDSKRVYALIQTANQGSLWRSDDAGTSWRVVSWDRRLIGRAGYYIRVAVNPKNADEVHVMNSSSHRSNDGGLTFPEGVGGCGDCHDEWLDPLNGDHWVTTGDGGAGISRNHGRNYTSIALPIGQQYHVAVDNQTPYTILSNRQDCCTMRGPSTGPVVVANVPSYMDGSSPVGVRRQTGGQGRGTGGAGQGAGGGAGQAAGGGGRGGAAGSLTSTAWPQRLGGCESGFTLALPGNPDIVWATCYGNTVTRYDARLGQARSVSPWMHTLDSPPDKLEYRCHWTPPLAFDPFEEETVYYGCQVIFKTTDRGQSWSVISPDLSTRDPSRIAFSGGVIGDNLGQFYGEVVFAIAPSPVRRGLIWAGTNDGKLWYTSNGGGEWIDVTQNVGMAEWGTVRRIEPSVFDANVAYIAVDYHMMDDREPYIYKTADLGKTWTKITNGLPSGQPLAYVMTVAENANRRGMLFAGTGNGFYYSLDDGASWKQLQDGLPAAPVTWIAPQQVYHDVVVSTYGRGIFVLRDITPLEQPEKASAAEVLYTPRAGIRQARSGSVDFLYKLAASPAAPVRIEILTSDGKVVRTTEVAASPGLNRATWDLRHDPPQQVTLRTTPPDNPHIWEEARFKDRDTRPIVHWGIQNPQRQGVLASPGKYTVRMTVDGRQHTEQFEVIRDAAISSSDADLVASTQTQLRIVSDINESVDLLNRLEVVGRQIEDQLRANQANTQLAKELRALEQQRMYVLLQLLSRTELHSDDKWYVEAYRIYLNLLWLYGEVGTGAGDVAGGAEYRPTAASLKTLAELEQQLATARGDFQRFMEETLPEFNRRFGGVVTIADRPVT